eukprot:c2008_g1_i1.p1 GENE.c2008_g1_i1~~c2008_g1_i1.p1  ORF type:complete len:563 (+),score=134.48 c2008_g1_i1:120-1808(+)
MLLSRAQASTADVSPGDKTKDKKKRLRKKKKPKLDDFIKTRDYTGAITLLEFHRKHADETDKDVLMWLGFAYFHNGDARAALGIYEDLLRTAGAPDELLWTNIALCKFYLGQYKEAEEAAMKGAPTGLQNRVLFHLAHKFGNTQQLLTYHRRLQNCVEDQMCLASVHYMRQHYNEAIEVYQHLLSENREFTAMNVYMAMCYYKLDYYDTSLDLLSLYLAEHPDSAVALNLKACNHFRLYDGHAAETEIRRLEDVATASFKFAQDLIRHNLVVFRGGEAALQVLPGLLAVLPEARLNLVIHYLHNDEVKKAFELMSAIDAVTPQEYILKGVVTAAFGQLVKSPEHLALAQKLYHVVGTSATERDTIPGRQCMASCLYLLGDFKEVLVYLDSVKSYFYLDDDFNYNYGVAKANQGMYGEALEALLLVQNERYRQEFCYMGWLARSYIMTGKPSLAWELYLRTESSGGDAFNLLTLIANDAYRVGHFLVAAQAFTTLERSDPTPEAWDAKRGACIGAFQQIIAKAEPPEVLREVVGMLRQTPNSPQVELIVRTMVKWAKSNRVEI